MGDHALAGRQRLAGSRWLYPGCAAAIAAGALLELRLAPGMTTDPIAPWVVLAVCLPVVAARRYPVAAAATEGLVLAFGPAVDGGFPTLSLLALAAIAYGCGAHAGSREGAAGIGALLALLLAESAAAGFPAVLAVVAPWWTGRQVRRRRELVRELAERTRELEAEQETYARLSVQRERARIARDLHDIVAHHLAVIVVQAGAGRLAAAGHAGADGERFTGIRQAGEHALAEMARLVDVLHADDGGTDAPGSLLRPLLEHAHRSGLQIQVTPLPRDVVLPAPVEEAAYRVVQEGLTNAIKHALGSAVAVDLRVAGDALEVEVRNAREAAPSTLSATGTGSGLRGMRERIEALGGQLDAGPDGGGWRLFARLPLAGR